VAGLRGTRAFPRDPRRSNLSARRPRTCLRPPFPPLLARRGSSSHELRVPFRALRPAACPRRPPDLRRMCLRERLPWSSVPSSRRQPAASTHARGIPVPHASVRPRRFSRPRRFTPPLALRVCFTPQPRPGFALQGVVPSRGAGPGFPEPSAFVPLSAACLWCDPGRPTMLSTSRPCSPRKMRWASRPVKASTTPRPSWACASTGDSPRTPWQRFHAAFACTLHRDEPTAAESWRLAGARSGWSGIRLPTRARFLA
jgi:hypothetical protein